MRKIITWLCFWKNNSNTKLQQENIELRQLVEEMYEWTLHKNTRWSKQASKYIIKPKRKW